MGRNQPDKGCGLFRIHHAGHENSSVCPFHIIPAPQAKMGKAVTSGNMRPAI